MPLAEAALLSGASAIRTAFHRLKLVPDSAPLARTRESFFWLLLCVRLGSSALAIELASLSMRGAVLRDFAE